MPLAVRDAIGEIEVDRDACALIDANGVDVALSVAPSPLVLATVEGVCVGDGIDASADCDTCTLADGDAEEPKLVVAPRLALNAPLPLADPHKLCAKVKVCITVDGAVMRADALPELVNAADVLIDAVGVARRDDDTLAVEDTEPLARSDEVVRKLPIGDVLTHGLPLELSEPLGEPDADRDVALLCDVNAL